MYNDKSQVHSWLNWKLYNSLRRKHTYAHHHHHTPSLISFCFGTHSIHTQWMHVILGKSCEIIIFNLIEYIPSEHELGITSFPASNAIYSDGCKFFYSHGHIFFIYINFVNMLYRKRWWWKSTSFVIDEKKLSLDHFKLWNHTQINRFWFGFVVVIVVLKKKIKMIAKSY